MIILDTNVLSELMRPTPSADVSAWVAAQPDRSLFTTAINEAEILLGVALLPAGRRQDELREAISLLFAEDLTRRVLPFDRAAATHFASLVAARRAIGRPLSHADGQIAAIARAHGASIATRNTADFESCGLSLINPWST